VSVEQRLEQLVRLARDLGRPERDLVVLAEGNVSTLLDDGSFFVKASGARMAELRADDVVRLRLEPLLAAVQDHAQCDEAALLAEARTDRGRGRASIETFVHVVCLGLAGAHVALHTHPTPLVGILCSRAAEELLTAGPLFPDEVVVCGAAPLYVGYYAPGLPLARALVPRLRAHVELHGAPPRAIHLANHGLFALGDAAADALAVTEMAVKAARVRLAALAAGGLRPLEADSVAELASRPDELERRRRLTAGS
jgi:rhamnose utilization protein RhaD (predicted bifunctional aldolase and dehydrogenase)